MNRTVSIIGAGRVGRTLGKCLHDRGWRIGAVVTRSKATSRAAARAIGDGTPYQTITRDALGAGIILLTTPDDLLASTAAELARTAGREACRGKIILHASGALDCGVLRPLARVGAATGSLHPMQTFSGRNVPKLQGTTFAVEGDRRAAQAARSIARSLGGVPVDIAGRNKPAYHASAILVAGHTLALAEAATEVLMDVGFPRRRALETLLPLMKQVLANFERLGPRASWTGPVARGDYAVVARHMKALRRYPPEFEQSYATLARLSVRVLSENPGPKLRQLERALKNPRGGKT
ncbi:MAG: DUF2520 domain-containing protein [Candidatus Acidiferrales bacterium]|jgi:predicted short-subunit dehydrogenase-like oxidoreductase (DUF2520 family)